MRIRTSVVALVAALGMLVVVNAGATDPVHAAVPMNQADGLANHQPGAQPALDAESGAQIR